MIGILMDTKNKGTVVPLCPGKICKKGVDFLQKMCYYKLTKRKKGKK